MRALRVRHTMLLAGVLTLELACGDPANETTVAPVASDLYVLTTSQWPVDPAFGYRTVPVCWEQSAGFDTEKAWVRDAFTKTWEAESQLRFVGFGTCGASTPAIRVFFQDASAAFTKTLGTGNAGIVKGMTLSTWVNGCKSGWTRERCVRATAVHEMAHGLGFTHEQNRSDTPASCRPCTMTSDCNTSNNEVCRNGHCAQGPDGNATFSSWDVDSVTNYCNPIWNGDGRLSGGDIYGLEEMYGAPLPVAASTWGGSSMAAFVRGSGDALYEATSTNGTTWSSFGSLGGVINSPPTAASWGLGRLDVFARGTDGAVWQNNWTSSHGWYGWSSLGGIIKGKPKAIARDNNRLDVFARGTDDSLWVVSWNGSGWSWTWLGDDVVGEPSISSWGPNRLDVVVRSRDNNVHHISWNGASWSAWTNLGGADLQGNPTIASWGPNRLDLVAVGGDRAVWHRWSDGSSWSGWESLGGPGPLFGTAKITARTANVLDIFARASDNTLWKQSWTGSNWTGWGPMGSLAIKGSPEVQTPDANTIQVFAEGWDNAAWQKIWTAGTWTDWTKLTGAYIQ